MPKRGRPEVEPISEAARRQNVLLSVRLRCRTTGARFCVSTYHMPCLFGSDPKVQVMVLHAGLVAKHAAHFADGLPHVLAGDFNFAPETAPYSLMLKGSLPKDHPHYPPMPPDDTWQPALPQPLRSAYLEALGVEPELTNLAMTKGQAEPFVGTLDYIFVSDAWAVRGVRSLPTRQEVLPNCVSYPTASEPSDHVLIWADLDPAAPVAPAA